VICPPAASRRISRQEPRQPFPFLLSQIMTIQSIKHRTDLDHTAPEDPQDTP
jgi:hypothetical protein